MGKGTFYRSQLLDGPSLVCLSSDKEGLDAADQRVLFVEPWDSEMSSAFCLLQTQEHNRRKSGRKTSSRWEQQSMQRKEEEFKGKTEVVSVKRNKPWKRRIGRPQTTMPLSGRSVTP